MIYMDNAATKLGNYNMPNINSPYASEHKQQFEDARKSIANKLHIEPENIYFTSGGCEANSWVLQRSGCKNIITTKIEHPSVLNCCKWLEKQGCKVVYLDTDEHGYIDLFDLDEAINNMPIQPILVSIMAVNNEIGTVQYLEGIRKVIDFYNDLRQKTSQDLNEPFDYQILFHADCVQAIGTVDIDLSLLDMFSASGHKFGAQNGIGFLYSKIKLEPLIFGGSQEQGIRGGTSNYNGVLSMANALEHKIWLSDCPSIKDMTSYFREQLTGIDCIINTPEDSISPIISVSFKDINAEGLMIYLANHKIFVSAGSACSTDHKEISHVLQEIKVPDDYVNGTIRFSMSEMISKSDIDTVIKLIKTFIELSSNST